MIKVAASEIKARFNAVFQRRMERWDKDHPEPDLPSSKIIKRELSRGYFEVDDQKLKQALKEEDGYAVFVDVILTKSIKAWKQAKLDRDNAREEFCRQLSDAKDSYLDRVLFDHENGLLLLRDFQRWTSNGGEQ